MQHPDIVTPAQRRHRRALWAAGLVVFVFVVAGLVSVHMKQDDNWDLQNYHIYNAFSLLNGRLGTDLWANQQQITFNPLLDLPYYAAARLYLGDYPRCVAFLAGLPFGALVLAAGGLNVALLGQPCRGRLLAAAIATGLGVCGTTVTGEIGTTFGDIPTACLVLAGLTALLVSVRDGTRRGPMEAAAGFALGLAAGLKLTAGLYAPAAFIAILCCTPHVRRVRAAAIFAAAWLAAFIPPVFWWGRHLLQAFASPVFPLFNALFASPWASATNSLDTRFLPHGLAQWVAYPFFWLRGQPFRVSEGPVRDAHFAAAYVAILALLARRLWSRTALPRAYALLLVFVCVSFALWEAAFSILRYALPLEVLTGTLVVLAIDKLVPAGRPRAVALVTVPLAMLAVQAPYDTGRLKRYGRKTFEIAAPALPAQAAVAFLGRPTSFVAPFLQGRHLVFLGLGGGGDLTPVMAEAMRARLSAAPNVFAVLNRDSEQDRRRLEWLGWAIDGSRCRPVANPFQAGIVLCPTFRAASGRVPSG